MDIFNQIFQFILSISILVILHELGHFIPAKLFKTRVDKFYLFFDPWFSIFKKKIGQTEYGIGWLPFGGYVKIAGMIDESMDKKQLKKTAQPWEFRAKPAWQRLIVMLGGITVNFFLAWFIYSCLSFFSGEKYYDNSKFENGISVSGEGQKMGLQTGDKILKVDGKPAERMGNSMVNMLFAKEATVIRNGNEVTFPINEDGVAEVIKSGLPKQYISTRYPAVVSSIVPNSGAEKAGLIKGDKIVSVNSQEIKFFDELVEILNSQRSNSVVLGINRGEKLIELSIEVNEDGKIGFEQDITQVSESLAKTYVLKNYTLLEAIPRGFNRTIETLVMQIKQFRIIFNQKTQGYKKVSGPIGIIKQMPKSINWTIFWEFTAMFSVWLAFLNLIPIPGLDGGHALFSIWEIITRKPVPQKVLENAQVIGMMVIFGLMILIFGSDIYKLIAN